MQGSRKSLVSASAGIILLLLSVIVHAFLSADPEQVAGRASAALESKSARAAELAAAGVTQEPSRFFGSFSGAFKEEQVALYLFRNDSLAAWNNAQIPFSGELSLFGESSGLRQLNHGYYYYELKRDGNRACLTLLRIKPRYELQNRYLSNDFARWLRLPKDIEMLPDSVAGAPVTVNGKVLFRVAGNESSYSSRLADDICFSLLFAGLILLMVSILMWLSEGAWQPAAAGILGLLVLRVLMLTTRSPQFLYNSTLYDVRMFGNAAAFANGYLGDILINASILLMVSCAFRFVSMNSATGRWIFRLGALALVFIAAGMFNRITASVVSNSTLNFNFLDFMNLSVGTFVALVSVALVSVSVFMLLRVLVEEVHGHKWAWAWILCPVAAYPIVLFSTDGRHYWIAAAWLPAVSVLLLLAAWSRRVGPVTSLALYLLLMSATASAMLSYYISLNETKNLEVLTLKLAERQDEVLENEFGSTIGKLFNDEQVGNLLRILPASAEAVSELVNTKYFGGYFKRYTVEFSLFDKNCRPLIGTTDPVLQNEGFFTDQIRFHSDSVSRGLHFVSNFRRNATYIAAMPLGEYRLYALLQPKQFEELGSFPDLLLDESQQRHEKLAGFSYAVYRADQNTSNYGSLNYPPFFPDSANLAKTEPEYVHWYFSADDHTKIIISRPVRTWAYFFTFNSYMLLLFSITGYLLFVLYSSLFTDAFSTSSLTRRIQAIIILLLLVAMSAVGYTSARLVSEQFAAENTKELREKTEIIFTDLSRMFSPEQLFDPTNREAVNTRLNEYSRLFNTDVSLFNAAGFLYATSQPRLYSLGLSARFADPVAVHRLSGNESSAVTIRERAGRLSYMSLYTALYAPGSNLPAGYINLPYFARQNDLVAELSGIVNGLVNVYVILFVVSILAGLLLAGYITRPLRLIQQQIARISLGGSNEKIDWQGSDELGRLIAEYNQMLVKLGESANRLAQSERESAWREMAKQVAHEIKNPLTPMKLNIQYLQHLLKTDPADFREKFEKASAGIIEQIDSLASIANEFSHFAKLPVSQVQTINIVEVIQTSLLLFEHRERITIRNRIPEEEIMVKADRDQCLRVFNNLFTNAVQALQDVPEPWIEIACEMDGGKVVIQVRDNGCGISEELQPKIFTPNFTTKSTGSGLGLAMVKNIVEGFGGRIWFESEKGGGTVFYVEFRLEN